MKSNQSLVAGALILVIASFINRILGFVYKILIVRLIGTEGVGLFQMVLPPFTLLLVLTTAGIPLSLSKLIAQKVAEGKRDEVNKIFLASLKILFLSSVIIASSGWYFAPRYINLLFSDPRVYWAYLTLIPALIVVAFSSAYRGYFLGLKQMFPSALSQVTEQIVRLTVGLISATTFLPFGIEYATIGLALGTVAGEIAGLLILIIFYQKNKPITILKKSHSNNTWAIIKSIYSLSIPLTLNRIVVSLLFTAHAIIIPARLQAAGYSIREATDLFGQFTGIALTLVNLPSILTVSIATTLVPAISEALAANNHALINKRALTALKITVLAGIPWVIVFYTMPGLLCKAVFNTPNAGIPLKYLAFGAFFSYLQQTTAGIIQGMGKMLIILRNTLIGAAINITAVYMLTGTALAIKGTAIAVSMGSMVIAILNLTFLKSTIEIRFEFRKLLPLTVAGVTMAAAMFFFSQNFSIWDNSLGLTFSNLLIGMGIYTVSLFFFQLISINDLKRFKRL